MAMIDFARPDGTRCAGYLAESRPGAPGIVVLHEWWGLNEQIKAVADRFAASGYNALAPDLFEGRVTQEPDEARHLVTGLDWVGAADRDIAGAVHYLASFSGKIGILGYCMGGALAIAACARVAGISCGVPYYGLPPRAVADPAAVKVPIQGHFANIDDRFTPELVDEFEKVMAKAGNQPEIYRYDAAHAFALEAGAAYDAEAAQQAWERTLAFLGRHLGE